MLANPPLESLAKLLLSLLRICHQSAILACSPPVSNQASDSSRSMRLIIPDVPSFIGETGQHLLVGLKKAATHMLPCMHTDT